MRLLPPTPEQIAFVRALKAAVLPLLDVIGVHCDPALASEQLTAIVHELAPFKDAEPERYTVTIGSEVINLGGEDYLIPTIQWPDWVANVIRRVADHDLDIAIQKEAESTP